MKLAIGTAQFGLDYGISNKHGQVSIENVNKILEAAKKANITMLDTASTYGSCEEILGSIGVGNFDVITKFGAKPKNLIDIKGWVYKQIEEALLRLKLNSVYGLLLHKPYELLDDYGNTIYEALSEAKSQKLVKNIGISIYDPSELSILTKRFDINIVQAPMNIIDRRLHSSGWLRRLNKLGVKVHVRSVFLQGLLLMNSESRPNYFDPWRLLFKDYDDWLARSKISAIEACIGFIKQFKFVDQIIIGISSPSHLDGICNTFSKHISFAKPQNIQSDDINLINPTKWRL